MSRPPLFNTFPAAGSRVTTFLLTTVLVSIAANAAPRASPATLDIRHEHEHDHSHHSHHGSGDGTVQVDQPALSDVTVAGPSSSAVTPIPLRPDPHGHSHGSHVAAKVTLDDQSVHQWHHFPPTYLAADFRLDNDSAIFGEEFDETWDPDDASGHKILMIAHIVGMTAAYFGALPITLALRAADHPSHYLANAAFLVIAILGWLAGVAYKAGSVDRYEASVHGGFGNFLLLVSVVLATLDSLGLIKRAISFYRSGNRSWKDFTREVFHTTKDRWLDTAHRYEVLGLDEHEDEHDQEQPRASCEQGQQQRKDAVFSLGEGDEEIDLEPRRTLSKTNSPRRPLTLTRQWSSPSRNSTGSEGTLQDTPPSSTRPHIEQKFDNGRGAYDAHSSSGEPSQMWRGDSHRERRMTKGRMVQILLTCARRAQVVIAYVVLLTGLTTYTGMCRAGFINACAAHFIKGSIFFGYGLITFVRYLGAYADMGWAWNRRPYSARGPSAEMIECCIIFVYGITNTWMERFGAHPGDPYSVKQVQHISIAVMFWFAGLTGILLESKAMRRVLSSMIGRRGEVDEPPSYAFSFNPLPGLVIAVTGLTMAAHHQDYVYQVSIHSLWGILLAGGSAFRFLTYFFLWLRPPVESTLPSRPPTEVLTSFGYAAGGIVFMLSVEEVSFAAMRAGYDDMMAVLNFTIALTSLVFCWEVVVMAIKGGAVMRLQGGERREIDGADEEARSCSR